MTISAPRSLRDPIAIASRRALLGQPHIADLRDYAACLRAEGAGTVPEFDPMDGGVRARLLFLMEKPGPMTDDTGAKGRIGSGFVSRDNDDPTAEAIFGFMRAAGIAREETVLWNVVPWWNDTREIKGAELAMGLERLGRLLDLLPQLRAVIGVGRRAGRAKALIAGRGLSFHESAHPSPINRAARLSVWASIPDVWRQAADG
ncbi:uracil-DNA glycosylase [Paracoccus indicus]|uniref:uracil-DNA glycosylase n=1 Tax=Paracoccus indicus TaxID=2079229 RepID=UPI000D389AA4|nr:uracil-DNA glycosylase [Paracoccus indicus]